MKLSSLGERVVVSNILKIISKAFPEGQLPLGDDAAAFKLGDVWVILKIDGSSANMSKYEFMSWYDFGWRVTAAAVTDVIAKGGRPLGIVSSIGIPKDMDEGVVYEVVGGVTDLTSSINAYVLGGDINESVGDVWIDVAVVGVTSRLIPALGLKPGDELLVDGCLGLSAIPYIIYINKLDPIPWTDILMNVWRVKPPVEFLSISDKVRVATDVSDGLTSVSRLLELNNVGLLIDEIPLCDECLEFAEEVKVGVKDFIKFLGEEFRIVFTVGEGGLSSNYLRLGTVVSGSGILLKGEKVDFGWEYFRGFH